MGYTFTRKELYEKVWLEPLSTLAPKLNISDVALGKICKKANIPRPHRGYWAKLKAGKPVTKLSLAERFPGASNIVYIGSDQYANKDRDLLNDPLPPPPFFEENILVVRERIQEMVGKVAYHTLSNRVHPIIAIFLERDEALIKEYKENRYSWYKPKFYSPLEKRRLRILNSIFLACHSIGCGASMSTSQYNNDNRKASIDVGDQLVNFTLEAIRKGQHGNNQNKDSADSLKLSIHGLHHESNDLYTWKEDDNLKIEKNLTQIINEIILSGEQLHRETARWRYDCKVKYKAELVKEERKRKIEEQRLACELLERQKQECIDRLLTEATALQQAETIRRYVQSIQVCSDQINVPMGDIEKWAAWAMKLADRIDPIKNLTFLEHEIYD